MRLSRAILLSLVLCGCERAPEVPTIATDQPVAVALTLSTNRILVGNSTLATLTIRHPSGTTPAVPDLGRDRDIVVRDRTESTRAVSAQAVDTTYFYTLTSLRPGEHQLATGTVAVAVEGEIREVPIPFLALSVGSSLLDQHPEPADIKGVVSWPDRWPRWILAAALVSLLALAGGMATVLALKRRGAKAAYEPPPVPAHEEAFLALERLKARGWIESGELEPFYLEVSLIVRRYLERRFHLHAPERTTEELLLDAVTSRALDAEHQNAVARFLERCDLVKFARHQPSSSEMQNAFQSAWRLVEETRLAPPTVPVQPPTTNH